MNLTRRNILKALGIGAAVSVSGASIAKAPKVINWDEVQAAGKLMDAQEVPSKVYVYTEADLPTPVNGVITMRPNTDYIMMNTISTTNSITGPLNTSLRSNYLSSSIRAISNV